MSSLYQLRKNEVTGTFLVLANKAGENENSSMTCKGYYFRDTDPSANSPDYSDVLIERGGRILSSSDGGCPGQLLDYRFYFSTFGGESQG